MGEARPVEADEHPVAVGARDAFDRPGQGGDGVGGVVGGGVARSGVDDEQVVGVVARRQVRGEPDPALVGGLGVLLVLRGGEHERGVQVDDGDPGQLPPGDRQPGEPLRPGGQQFPPAAAEPGDGVVEAGEGLLASFVEEPPHRRGRGHRPGHRSEMA